MSDTKAKLSPNTISIDNYAFSPNPLKVKKGTTVTWVNHDIAKHTITFDTSGESSEFIGKGQTYQYTFTKSGTYTYHCQPHPYMKGEVEVVE